MLPILLFFAISLLHSYEAQDRNFTECSAVTPVYLQTGKDLILDVTTPVVMEGDDELKWLFDVKDKRVAILSENKTKAFGRYKGRARISLQNHSLLLRNMQQADSGDYRAWIVDEDGKKCMDEYNVIVQDPVSHVELTVEYASNSSNPCILSVTCCTRDSDHINGTLRCVNSTCNLTEGVRTKVTPSSANLEVYLVNGTITCSHSNEVSSSIKVIKEVQQFCQADAVDIVVFPHEDIQIAPVVIAVVTAVGIAALALSLCLFIKWKIGSCKHKVGDVPQDITLVQTLNQDPTGDLSLTSSYTFESPHTRPDRSPETQITVLPEMVYAQVYRAAEDRDITLVQTLNPDRTGDLSLTSSYAVESPHTRPDRSPEGQTTV